MRIMRNAHTLFYFSGLSYEENSLLCSLDKDGRPDHCGYACEEPKGDDTFYNKEGLSGDLEAFAGIKFCEKGCPVPFPGRNLVRKEIH